MKRIFILIFIIFMGPCLFGQSEPDRLDFKSYQRISGGYIFGGQVYNQDFEYNPGVEIQGIYGLKLSKRVSVGVGTGITILEDEQFLPLFAEVNGLTSKKNNSAALSMQVGYAHGWYNGYDDVDGLEFRGGIYFDAGLGKQLFISENISVLFRVSYRHQFAQMRFETFNNPDYKEAVHYDMLVLSLGILNFN
ncbi:hypothetical protein [Salinivirga cyanobacteriivorans]